jgi:phosphoribosylformimino-5-aminoimidazole carboxamide ribotide isomerase
LFPKGKFGLERLEAVLEALGREKDKLVVDLSCRRRKERGESQDGRWVVAMDQWQRDTDMEVCKGQSGRHRF